MSLRFKNDAEFQKWLEEAGLGTHIAMKQKQESRHMRELRRIHRLRMETYRLRAEVNAAYARLPWWRRVWNILVKKF